MSVDKRESRVVVTQRQVTQVVSSGVQGPPGGQWANWDEIPDKPSTYPPSAHNHDAGYDPIGAAATAQAAAVAAAALDATGKIDALKDGVASDGDTLAKLRALIQGIQTLLTSDNASLDTLQEVVDFVELHQSDLEALGATKVNISDIINALNDTSSNKPLSAAQGKVLKDALDALSAVVAGKEPTIAAGSTSQYWRGDKSWRDFATDVRAAVLTGLSTATSTVVAAADSVLVAIGKLQAQITGHTGNTSNPHSVTKAQVGLGSVDNVSAASLRDRTTHTGEQAIGTVTGLQAALDGKQPTGSYIVDGDARLSDARPASDVSAWAKAPVKPSYTKSEVGLGNVDNTSDANKPVSTAQQTALDLKLNANDASVTNSREWTAATVDQAEAEAGTGTTRRAWTAQRVRQAIAAWWLTASSAFGRTLANVADAAAGRTALGLGTAATATVTTSATDTTAGRLLKVGDFGLGGTPDMITGSWNDLAGATRFVRGALNITTDGPFVGSVWLQGIYLQNTASNGTFFGSTLSTTSPRYFMRTYSTGVWSAWFEIPRYGDSPTFANLTATGNTTLGDSSSDTVTVNGVMGVGGAPLNYAGLFVQNSALSGTAQTGVVSAPVASSAATVRAVGYQATPGTAAATFTVPDAIGFRATDAIKGAGSTITNLHGMWVADQTQGTNNYGITSQVSAGTNKRNLNITGTADNVLMGNTGIGTTTIPDRLSVNGNITLGFNASPQLRQSTADGADDARIQLCGGGAAGAGRGGYINLHGNEHALHPGMCDLLAGDAPSGGSVRIYTKNADLRLQVTRDGVVDVISGQIKFPATQNASADANTLDDYEEGSFTPVVAGTTTAGTGTYTTQAGRYTKIGNRVFYTVALTWTAHTGTGNIKITGLPFMPVVSTVAYTTPTAIDMTYSGTMVAYPSPGAAEISIASATSGAGLAAVAMDSAAGLRISGHYEV